MSEQVIVRLTNREAKFDCQDGETIEALKPFFAFQPPGYQFMPRFKQTYWDPEKKQRIPVWDGFINLLKYSRVPSGLFLLKRSELEASEQFSFEVVDQRVYPARRLLPDHLKSRARPFQLACLDAMNEASNQGGLIIQATGSGKTFTAGLYFAATNGAGCFIVDELTLLEQARLEFVEMLGSDQVGMIGKGKFDPKRITVATAQSLQKHADRADFKSWFATIECLFIDEIHTQINRRALDIVQTIKPKTVFGLTATLGLSDPVVAMKSAALAGPLIFNYDLKQGTEEGYLAPGVVAEVNFEFPGIAKKTDRERDYQMLISHNRLRNTYIEGLVREAILRKHKVILLLNRRAHLRIMSHRFTDLPHQVLSGLYSQETRLASTKAMDAGNLPLILASKIFYKGINIKEVDVIIDATAGSDPDSTLQRYGRGVRKGQAKMGLIYIDIHDSSHATGFKNPFAFASIKRHRALSSLGMPIVRLSTDQPASLIFDRITRALTVQLKAVKEKLA